MSRPAAPLLAVALAVAALAALAAPPAGAQSDVDRLLEAGDNHLRAQRIDQAINLYHAVLRRQPLHDGAYTRLLRIDAARPLPDDPAQRNRLAAEFPEGFYLRQTDHYLLVYDAQHTWADTRAKLLETAHDTFMAEMRKAGFRPLPLRRRLEAVLFNDHADYAVHARDVDHIEREWAAGYYMPATNRLVVYNFHTGPQMMQMLTQMREAEANVERRKGEAAANPGRAGALRAAERNMLVARQRYETVAAWGNIKQTVHEAAHQLAYNSAIQRRDLQYPMWFGEGLATAFETIHPAAPFGPSHINGSRVSALDEARRTGRLMPIEQFITLDVPPDDEARRAAAYAQAWALFHMLFNQRTDQLRQYVADMLTAPAGLRSAEQFREDFIEHFGPLDEFNADWQQYLADLPR